jgi:hypothetical protein
MFADVGGAGTNFTSTVLDDDASTLIAAGSAPFTGSFQPQNSLDACLDGTDPSGAWTLRAWDDQGGDTGTIDNFNIEFEIANDLDGDGWGAGCECDDSDVTSFPGASEIPDDGIDQDCNGTDTVTCFVDGDLDGDGSETIILSGDGDCTDPGESWSNTDCDDSNPAMYPGATEICDGLDNDCSGLADFGSVPTGDDDDSAGDDDDSAGDDDDSAGDDDDSAGDDDDSAARGGDDDDSAGDDDDSAGDDDDSTGDDDDSTGPGFGGTEIDIDDDGQMVCEGDCDDEAPMTWTGATEICDGFDNDCDGNVPDEEVDVDSDGFSPCEGDCHDTNPAANPGNAENTTEVCSDGFDNDCDGLVDLDDDECDDLVGDDDDATGGDDDDDDDGSSTGLGCSCSAISDPGDFEGASLLLLGLLAVLWRRRD